MRRQSVFFASVLSSVFVLGAWGCLGEDPGAGNPGTNPDAGSQAEAGNPQVGGDGGGDEDAGGDAAPAPECDVAKPFATAVPVTGVNDGSADDLHAVLTDDELTIFFATNRGGASTVFHIYGSTRATRTESFPMPAQVPGTFSTEGESSPGVSGDGKTLVFDSFRPGTGSGVMHLWMATRASPTVTFETPAQITGDFLSTPSITASGDALYAEILTSGKVVRLPKSGGTYGTPETLLNVSTPSTERSPYSRDDLLLFAELGGNAQTHARASTAAAFSGATELSAVNTPGNDVPSWLSPDGCRLYLTHNDPSGDKDLYVATRPK